MAKKAKVQKPNKVQTIAEIREIVRLRDKANLAKQVRPITKANVAKPVKPTKAEILFDLAYKARIKNSITVGELIEQLKIYPAELKVWFGGLEFYRLRGAGEKTVQVEFVQNVYLNKRRKIVVDELRDAED